MENAMNIYQRMSAATIEIAPVAKGLFVETGKGKGYKAVAEADVIDAVKNIEAKYGIYSYPCKRNVLETDIITTATEYNGERKEKNQFFMRIETIYRFVNVDCPSEYIEVTTYGDGIDSGDKAPGKCVTYSDKYALLKAYKIKTGDDPDEKASEELSYTNKRTGRTHYATPTTPNAQPQTAQADDVKATEEQVRIIGEHYADPNLLMQMLNYYNVDCIANLPRATADSLIRKIKAKKGGQ